MKIGGCFLNKSREYTGFRGTAKGIATVRLPVCASLKLPGSISRIFISGKIPHGSWRRCDWNTRVGRSGADPYGRERFDRFLWRFCTDSVFNCSRVQFPYVFQQCNLETEVDVNDTISKLLWRPWFGHGHSEDSFAFFRIFDNMGKFLPPSDTMHLRYALNDNGISFGYLFVCRKGKWFLASGYDCSN